MILKMCRIRIMGPRQSLPEVLRVVQDLGLMHLASPSPSQSIEPVVLTGRESRLRRQICRILDDIETTLRLVGRQVVSGPISSAAPTPLDLVRCARSARRLRRQAERLQARQNVLEEERALLLKYRSFFDAFDHLLGEKHRLATGRAYHVILRPGQAKGVTGLRQLLQSALGEEFELYPYPLAGGETALLLLVPLTMSARLERLLAESGVEEISMPEAYGGRSVADAVPRMRERLAAIPRELEEITREREHLASQSAELARAGSLIHDRLEQLDAVILSARTRHAFIVEGWVPAGALPRLARILPERLGPAIAIEEVAAERWSAEAPVVLSNPRLLRPFELLIRLLPLPRYGSIDPTPFVAVFFPMFFGLILGDIGYGTALALLGLFLARHSSPDSTRRAVAQIAGACAAFTIIFGFLYGELFGDLGRRWFGLGPLLFDREKENAIIPFLGLAVALGLVHVILGLGLGVVSAFHGHKREAAGRGITAVMILLIVAALLAAFEVLPAALFTPSVVALLVAFPVLIIVEGLVAPVELLSTLGNILSYARIMALGTASVMLAIVANRMSGAFGSALVGAIFALLFHLVNFALGLFSPTIHVLRLHYVEFFGRFYSPGGTQFRPFTHWSPHPDHPT